MPLLYERTILTVVAAKMKMMKPTKIRAVDTSIKVKPLSLSDSLAMSYPFLSFTTSYSTPVR